jgi:glucokinase
VSDPVAIGIDVGGTKLVAATIAGDGTVLDRQRRETPARDSELLVRTLVRSIAELGGGADRLPVGIGIAGLVTPDGQVRYGPNIGVRDLPLAARLADAAGGPVTVVNDASAAAFGEQRVGAGRGRQDVVLFTLGTGVGGGVIVGGEVVLGNGGFAGELGHVIVAEGGRACPCGNRGCVEAYASGTSIGLIARERLVDLSVETLLRDEGELTGRSVTQAALAGDAFARSILTEAGRWLGVAAGSLVNVLDPEVILIGGGAAVQTSRWVLPAAEASLAEHLIGSPWRRAPSFELAALGDDAGMVGAALLAEQRWTARSAASGGAPGSTVPAARAAGTQPEAAP